MEGTMADVETGDILRLGCGLVYDGLYDVVNVWNVKTVLSAGRTWAQMIPLIQTWCNNVYDDLKATFSDEMGTGSISVANLTQITTLGAIPWSPSWGGTGAGDPTAAGVCLFAWARTYTPRVQIRKYFGVFAESNVTDGSFVVAAQEDAENAMDYAILSSEVATGMFIQAVAYNRTLGTYKTGVSVAVAPEPAYQRRRKRGRGS